MNPRALSVYEVVVALVAVQRLVELVHSRRNLARLSSAARPADSSGNWSALVALQTLWLAGCALESALREVRPPASVFWAGAALFLAGEVLRTWCILVLGERWNARARVDPGLRFVSRGPYQWIRHPNYLGVWLEFVGLARAGGAWWTLALLVLPHALVFRRRIRGEDALLFALPGYPEAMGAKGALLPRLSRR